MSVPALVEDQPAIAWEYLQTRLQQELAQGIVSRIIATSGLRINLWKVQGDDRVFELRTPISLDLAYDGDSWMSRNSDLGILAFGDSPNESIASFSKDFEALYDALYGVSDRNLTPRAAIAKRMFSDMVQHIEDSAA